MLSRWIKDLAVDLGFSGWLWRRYEVWVKEPSTRRPELWVKAEHFNGGGRGFTRRAAIRFAWQLSDAPPFRVELVNLATGKHELVRESVVKPEVDFEAVKREVLRHLDELAPGITTNWRYRQGFADCREGVKRAFQRRLFGP